MWKFKKQFNHDRPLYGQIKDEAYESVRPDDDEVYKRWFMAGVSKAVQILVEKG